MGCLSGRGRKDFWRIRRSAHQPAPGRSDPGRSRPKESLRRALRLRHRGAAGRSLSVECAADMGAASIQPPIAYLLSADKLTGKGPAKEGIEGIRGLPSGQELPHGRLLPLRRRSDLSLAHARSLRRAHLLPLRVGAAAVANCPATRRLRHPRQPRLV